MTKLLGLLLKIAISIALVWIVLYKVNLFNSEGRQDLFTLIIKANANFLVLSFLIGLLLNFVSAMKWWILLRCRRVSSPFWHVWSLYYVGKFYNLFLPTSVGGDIVRVYGLGVTTGQNIEAMASVIVDRFTGFITLIVLATASLVFGFAASEIVAIGTGLVLILIVPLGLSWALLSRWFVRVMGRYTSDVSLLGRLANKSIELRSTILAYGSSKILVPAFLFTLLFYFFSIINVWVSALVFNGDVAVQEVGIAVPIIMVVMNLPVSIGGIGLMEMAYTYGFDTIDLGATLGLSTALLMRIKSILDALIGGCLHFFLGIAPKAINPEEST